METPHGNRGRFRVLLLDASGSMQLSGFVNLLGQAMVLVVKGLAAAGENKVNGEDWGPYVITMGGHEAQDLGELTPQNVGGKWGDIGGGGRALLIVGWEKLQEVYWSTFGLLPEEQRPLLSALIFTDGEECPYRAQFEQQLAQVGAGTNVVLVVTGHGWQQDRALDRYRRVSAQNARVQVEDLGSERDPQVIAQRLLRLLA